MFNNASDPQTVTLSTSPKPSRWSWRMSGVAAGAVAFAALAVALYGFFIR